jgi:hypothetical protein
MSVKNVVMLQLHAGSRAPSGRLFPWRKALVLGAGLQAVVQSELVAKVAGRDHGEEQHLGCRMHLDATSCATVSLVPRGSFHISILRVM